MNCVRRPPLLATDGSRGPVVGGTLAAGNWQAPGVLFVGPAGSGKSTLLRAICHRLELNGATVTRGDEALGTAPTPTSVATVDGPPLRETVGMVISLIEDGWRVIGTTLGPTPQVGAELRALCDTGLVLLVELRSLPANVRRDVLRSELNDADPAAVDLMSRCGPGDGRALRVLAARARARAGLAGGPVDVGAAAAALRGGLRPSRLGPPVPRLIRDLMKLRSPGSPAAVVSSLAERLRPLSVLGPAEQAVVSATAGAPVAIAGGVESAVALRIALYHALRGRRVLLQTSTLSEPGIVAGLVRLATGRDRPDRDSDGLATELVAGLSLVVLADSAAPLSDLSAALRRCHSHTRIQPDMVVVEGRNFDELSCAEQIDVPVVAAASAGAALPHLANPSTIWDLACTTIPAAIRKPGRAWVRLPIDDIDGRRKGVMARDEAGAVLGWRLWRLAVDDQGPALQSPIRNTIWPRGVFVSACAACGATPTDACRCGIYAYADVRDAEAERRQHPNLVIGQLRCWGRVLRHETGFRAERAHPVLLHVGSAGTQAQRRALSARYGCEVTGGRQA